MNHSGHCEKIINHKKRKTLKKIPAILFFACFAFYVVNDFKNPDPAPAAV